MTACSLVIVTGCPPTLLLPSRANEASVVGSSNWAEDWVLSTNLVMRSRPLGVVPSSLSISIMLARPAALWVGSGRLTLTCSADEGPPAAGGSRKFQPTESLNAGIWAAALAGITSISGDLATETPVVWIRWAPSGKP